ncbi:MAG: TlpA family protein disulfide reductase [Chitinophagaceae bacterium]|nr:MAG: TlpA family protein disulfide reductase [Chitinophagaceae bacterium]
MRVLQWALLAMLWPAGITYAQTLPTNIRPLTVGDTLPANLVLENVVNYPASKIHLGKLKNDLIILDFFATWCGACLHFLPKLDSLQEQAGVKTLVIADEPPSKVADFFSKKGRMKPHSPIVCSDTILQSLFPNKIIPHTVIIYKNKVRAITYPSQVTVNSINNIRADENFKLPLKRDNFDYDTEKRLLVNDNGGASNLLLLQSSLIKNLSGVGSMAGRIEEKENNLTREYFINFPVIELISIALPDAGTNRVLLKVKDSTKFIYFPDDWDIWSLDNAYCYEIIYPKGTSLSKRNKKLLSDLKLFFGLNCYYDSLYTDCWVLRQTGTGIKQSREKVTSVSLLGNDVYTRQMTNAPMSKLLFALNYQVPARSLNPIVLDETGFTGTLDLRLPLKDLTDFHALAKLLAGYNISLTKEKRIIKLLVLEEASTL